MGPSWQMWGSYCYSQELVASEAISMKQRANMKPSYLKLLLVFGLRDKQGDSHRGGLHKQDPVTVIAKLNELHIFPSLISSVLSKLIG